MRILIDTEARTMTVEDGGRSVARELYSPAAFEALTRQWVRVGWSLRYFMNFTWLGIPILQMPEDLVRLQEVVWAVRPDVIVETGVYRGGSLVFHATLCHAIGTGRVIGIDREIGAPVREALARHPLAALVTLVEGDSASTAVIDAVRRLVRPGESVLVLLDSDHRKAHVRAELETYAPLVTPGSYIVACDGIVRDLADVPGGDPTYADDNPLAAAADFAAAHPEFAPGQPPWPCRGSALIENVTYWPGGWLRRRP